MVVTIEFLFFFNVFICNFNCIPSQAILFYCAIVLSKQFLCTMCHPLSICPVGGNISTVFLPLSQSEKNMHVLPRSHTWRELHVIVCVGGGGKIYAGFLSCLDRGGSGGGDFGHVFFFFYGLMEIPLLV